jgi:hypothetical protein
MKKKDKHIIWKKSFEPPSIPSHNHVYGYRETVDGRLRKQQNPDKIYTGEKEDKIGPGHYETSNEEKKTKGVVRWRSAHVDNRKKKEESLVGPGYYSQK